MPKTTYFQAKTIEGYLYQRVTKTSSRRDCWEWQAGQDKDGYGQCHAAAVAKNNGVTRAHQLAYVLWKGEIPKGRVVCHKCDNPRCCNPDHLFIGSVFDNNLDCSKKGRRPQRWGENNPVAKLSNEQVIEIRALKGKQTSLELAKRFHVSYSLICMIWRGDVRTNG